MNRGTVVVVFWPGPDVPPWGSTRLRVVSITDIQATTEEPIDEGQEHLLRFKEGYHPVIILEYHDDTTLADESVRVFASHNSDMVNLEKRAARHVESLSRKKAKQSKCSIGPLYPVLKQEEKPVEIITFDSDDSLEPCHVDPKWVKKRRIDEFEASIGSLSKPDGVGSKKPRNETVDPMSDSLSIAPSISPIEPSHFFEVSTQTGSSFDAGSDIAVQMDANSRTAVNESGELRLPRSATRSVVQLLPGLIKPETEPEIDFQQIDNDSEAGHSAPKPVSTSSAPSLPKPRAASPHGKTKRRGRPRKITVGTLIELKTGGHSRYERRHYLAYLKGSFQSFRRRIPRDAGTEIRTWFVRKPAASLNMHAIQFAARRMLETLRLQQWPTIFAGHISLMKMIGSHDDAASIPPYKSGQGVVTRELQGVALSAHGSAEFCKFTGLPVADA